MLQKTAVHSLIMQRIDRKDKQKVMDFVSRLARRNIRVDRPYPVRGMGLSCPIHTGRQSVGMTKPKKIPVYLWIEHGSVGR